MTPTVITMADSEGNVAQLHVADEVINLNTLDGASPTGITLGADTLDELTDVDVGSAIDGDSLIYDSGTDTWGPGTPAAAAAADPDAQLLAWLGL